MTSVRTTFALAGLATLAAAQSGPPAQPVVAAPIVARDVPPAIRLVGTVRPDKQAVIASEMAGLVAEFPAEEGAFLKAGDVICELDRDAAEWRVAEARAEHERLAAALLELKNGVRAEVLARLEAAAGEAEAMHQMWQFERDRIQRLFDQNQSNAKEKNDADAQYLAAERRMVQARAALEEARNGARVEELARATQALVAQEALLRIAERELRLMRVVAPFDGFVTAKRSEVGEWLERGGPVCEMVAIEKVKVRADAPEAVVPFAVAGAAARVEIEALGLTRAGTIARAIPAADPAARTFPVEIDLPNAEHVLLPGMFVWAYVPAGVAGERLMAPKDAIVARGTAKTIYVIQGGPGGGQMAIPMAVTTGLELAGEVEVVAAGLKAGDLVVTRANERLMGPTPVMVAGSAGAVAPAGDSTSAPADGGAARQ